MTTSLGEKDHTKSPAQHQQPSKWKEVPRGIISTTAQKLLNPKAETTVRRRSQTQTHVYGAAPGPDPVEPRDTTA